MYSPVRIGSSVLNKARKIIVKDLTIDIDSFIILTNITQLMTILMCMGVMLKEISI
jgi:hypothetical protein